MTDTRTTALVLAVAPGTALPGRALTVKQLRFVDEFFVDFNATAAAVRAGYSVRSAASIGSENLRKPEIRAEIRDRVERLSMPSVETLARLSAQARGDMPTKVLRRKGQVMLDQRSGDPREGAGPAAAGAKRLATLPTRLSS